jgi:hypothetical protein
MSEKKVQRSPEDIQIAIAEKSLKVKFAATQLSSRIQIFEAWLSKLPGRVETVHFGDHPDDDGSETLSFCLKLHRSGKDWIISYGTFHASFDFDRDVDWKPLREAPVRFKLLAIQQFPDLLEEIEKSQERLANEIKQACSDFDDFAAKLGIEEKERA